MIMAKFVQQYHLQTAESRITTAWLTERTMPAILHYSGLLATHKQVNAQDVLINSAALMCYRWMDATRIESLT